MRRVCAQCGGEYLLGDEHIHIGQVRVWSASWTGRELHRNYKLRVSTSVWAKLFVWFRDEALIRFCKSIGGHYLDWRTGYCEECGMSSERIADHPRTLRAGLNCWAVAL